MIAVLEVRYGHENGGWPQSLASHGLHPEDAVVLVPLAMAHDGMNFSRIVRC